MRLLSAHTITLVVGCSVAGVAPAMPEDIESTVRSLASPLIEAGVVPGLAIGLYEDGETLFVPIGATSPGGDTAPAPDTIYEVGSISKALTGLLLADAVRRGETTLDTEASTLAPGGAAFTAWEREARDPMGYTLLDLATHTSGLPRMPPDFAPGDESDPFADYSAEDLWTTLGATAPQTEPGSRYAYSNLGAGLLGRLLADRAGVSYPQLLHDRLTGPLGMDDTTVRIADADPDRLAHGFSPSGAPIQSWTFDALAGAGGVRSTVADMLTLIDAIAEPPSEEFAQVARLALEPHRAAPGGPPMGLGWHLAGDGVTRWHNGQTGGYHSMLLVRPADGLGVVVLANGPEKAVDDVGERIIQAMMGMEVEPPVVRRAVELSEPHLDRLVGVYDSGLGLVYTMSRDGGALIAGLTGQAALTVYPESETEFFYREVEATLVFDLPAEQGEPATAVTLHQNGRRIPFARRDD